MTSSGSEQSESGVSARESSARIIELSVSRKAGVKDGIGDASFSGCSMY